MLAKARRIYFPENPESAKKTGDFINDELEEVNTKVKHLEVLLSESGSPEELNKIDLLQQARNEIFAAISELDSYKEFVRSGLNVFGYDKDYVPFYNGGAVGENIDTFDAIRQLVIGNTTKGSMADLNSNGFFGLARRDETNALRVKDQLLNTKDRIRNELFTINEQAETRLAQLCGRIDKNGKPSVNLNDDIDYDLKVSSQNSACDIGQKVLQMQRAQEDVKRAQADIRQLELNIESEKKYLDDAVAEYGNQVKILQEYSNMQQNLTRELGQINAEQARVNATFKALDEASKTSTSWSKWITGDNWTIGPRVTLTMLNGVYNGTVELRKAEKQAEKEKLQYEERIKLTESNTELFKLQEEKNIEQMLNQMEVKNITTQIAEIDLQIAIGQLNQYIAERDELLARRGRALANLGEMSYANPSFRLYQFNAMTEADTSLQYLKGWIYLMARSLYYKWVLPEDFIIQIQNKGSAGQFRMSDIFRIRVVGANDPGIIIPPLSDSKTAADIINTLCTFNDQAPMFMGLSRAGDGNGEINAQNSNKSSRFSLREDFLRIVRNDNSDTETARIRKAFNDWFCSKDRLDPDGNWVVDYDTRKHLEDYDLPVGNRTWMSFADRTYGEKPLWNHKISRVGVAVKATGIAFQSGVANILGSLLYGGAGYIRGYAQEEDVFRTYQMRQWIFKANMQQLEPVSYRTVALTIPTSAAFDDTYLKMELQGRPVSTTSWRLIIPKGQWDKINTSAIEDIFIYINSNAYISQ